MLDKIGFWIADRVWVIITIEVMVATILIIYGVFWHGFEMKGYN
jgi:hypothetical protein